jgi:hypothetical protein
MELDVFEYGGDYTADGMTDWFEIYDSEQNAAWLASDTTMEIRA